MSNRTICGKGLLNNKVRVSFSNHGHSIMRIFETSEIASLHYEELELGDKISFREYIKYKLCKHHTMYDLHFDSNRYNYRCCSNCNKSEYIKLERDEQIQERWNAAFKASKLDEIKELQDDIIEKEKYLVKMKREFKTDYGEDIK